MKTFLDLISPKSQLCWIWKTGVIAALAVLIDVLSLAVVFHHPVDLLADTLSSAFAALPIVFAGLYLVSHLHRLQLGHAELADTDDLTGLPNRRGFQARAGRVDGGALLVVDIDHFKAINDTYGHVVGDICLRELATQLRRLTRAEDLLGRLGGEEFAVLLQGATLADARRIGQRIAGGVTIEIPRTAGVVERYISLTTSVGAVAMDRGAVLCTAIGEADRALYDAKRAGRARVVVADDASDTSVIAFAEARA